jgi:hypothetical protein
MPPCGKDDAVELSPFEDDPDALRQRRNVRLILLAGLAVLCFALSMV